MEAITFAAMIGFFESLRKSATEIWNSKKENDRQKLEKFNEVQTAVMRAINNTRSYLVEFNEGNRNRKTEEQLVEYWMEASRTIKQMNPQLAADFAFKSNYWADPINDASKKKARKLDDILRDITEIIDPQRKISPSEEKFISLRLNDTSE